MSIIDRPRALGYEYESAALQRRSFYVAVRSGNLVFSSGQLPVRGETEYRGKVGEDLDLAAARRAAEICAHNCLRAIGAVIDIESVTRVVKMLGMVNCGAGFTNTSAVIDGATDFLNSVFGAPNTHSRSAVGMVLPDNWVVEIKLVAECAALPVDSSS